MDVKQIAWIVNEQLLPNIEGIGEIDESTGKRVCKVESLGELVDIGKALDVENLDANTFLDWTKTFIPEIARTHFDMVKYKMSELPIIKSYEDFVGLTQSVKQKRSRDVSQSPIFNLVDGNEYNPNIYHGIDADTKVYGETTTFDYEYSVPITMYRGAFSESGMLELVAYIENCVDNDVAEILEDLAFSTLRVGICKHKDDRVKLLKIYNDTFNATGTRLTVDDALRNRSFLSWVNETIKNVQSAMTKRSKKYNDGTCITHTPKELSNLILLDMFANASQFNLEGITYHDNKVSIGTFTTVGAWEFTGENIVPNFTDVSIVKGNFTGQGTDDIVINHVIGVIADDRTCAVAMKPTVTRAHFNAKGNFNNFFTSYNKSNRYDGRENFVVFTLEDE